MCFHNNPILCSFVQKTSGLSSTCPLLYPLVFPHPYQEEGFYCFSFQLNQIFSSLPWPGFSVTSFGQILMVRSQASSYSSDQQYFTCWCHDLSRNAFFTWNVGNKTVLNFHLISLATLSQSVSYSSYAPNI